MKKHLLFILLIGLFCTGCSTTPDTLDGNIVKITTYANPGPKLTSVTPSHKAHIICAEKMGEYDIWLTDTTALECTQELFAGSSHFYVRLQKDPKNDVYTKKELAVLDYSYGAKGVYILPSDKKILGHQE